MTWYQEWFGEDYLELYAHRGEDEARMHARFVHERFDRIDGLLLDLACGSGRHQRELEALGYDVLGLDLSPYLLARARMSDSGASLVRADMRMLPLGIGTVAGLVNFFTSFGYFEDDEDNEDVVREMARVLRPGAPFLFDYMNVPLERERLVSHEEQIVGDREVRIERWFDTGSRTFNKRIFIGNRSFLERVRAYEPEEIRKLFEDAGLVIEAVCGDFESCDWTPESPRLVLIGRRG
ncbi:MAG: class I SAM-dependent methyltransferase [Acidobacteria bacterium]|nr:class I SAM-dependent methyltransferase [Acidobacteriota bacterium]